VHDLFNFHKINVLIWRRIVQEFDPAKNKHAHRIQNIFVTKSHKHARLFKRKWTCGVLWIPFPLSTRKSTPKVSPLTNKIHPPVKCSKTTALHSSTHLENSPAHKKKLVKSHNKVQPSTGLRLGPTKVFFRSTRGRFACCWIVLTRFAIGREG